MTLQKFIISYFELLNERSRTLGKSQKLKKITVISIVSYWNEDKSS